MRSSLAGLLVGVAGGMCLGVSASASAYYLESRGLAADGGAPGPVRYETMEPVTYRLGPMSEERAAAVAAAFESWAAVGCSDLAFAPGDPLEEPIAIQHWDDPERYIAVHFESDGSQWSSPQVGRFFFGHDGTGRMIGATISLNAADHAWSATGEAGALDVQSIVTALIGRSLGITAEEEGNATFPRYRPGDTTKRDLGTEDTDALQYVYGDSAECMPPPPTAICTGAFGEECPPPVETNPGNGGTGSEGFADAGTVRRTDPGRSGPGRTGRDAGVLAGDGGMAPAGASGEGGGGCSVASTGRSHAASLAWIMGIGILALGARRRRG